MTDDQPHDPQLEDLLEYLRVARAFDFTGYKRASLTRRITKRMHDVGIDAYDAYRDYVEVHPDEFEQLFNTILINVTSFFRDPAAWDFLRSDVVPEIAVKGADEKIRVWSAGCSSGEEAYTTAMVFAEAIGAEAYRDRVKIYATDVDEDALASARSGRYGDDALAELPAELRERYFTHEADSYLVDVDLRRNVIFGRLDIVDDAPISRIDLLVCRNTLMYFNAETQSKILQRMHFALADPGYIFLGKAELMLSRNDMFAPVDTGHRIFKKVPQPARRRPALPDDLTGITFGRDQSRLLSLAFDEAPVAQLITDVDGRMIAANFQSRELFDIDPRDVGRPLRDLEISYRPIDLRSCLDEAKAGGIPVEKRGIERVTRAGKHETLDAKVQPIVAADGTYVGMSVTFSDVTEHARNESDLRMKSQELETTSEELQSTNEELETTNEELQSTNEELETMNEELRSSNEELETMNDEMRLRADELDDLNAFMTSILGGLKSAVAVVDPDLEVLVWNDKATDMWGLRDDEAEGETLPALDIGLTVEKVADAARACLRGESAIEERDLRATTRRGKQICCHVVCTPLLTSSGQRREPQGVVIEMREAL